MYVLFIYDVSCLCVTPCVYGMALCRARVVGGGNFILFPWSSLPWFVIVVYCGVMDNVFLMVLLTSYSLRPSLVLTLRVWMGNSRIPSSMAPGGCRGVVVEWRWDGELQNKISKARMEEERSERKEKTGGCF